MEMETTLTAFMCAFPLSLGRSEGLDFARDYAIFARCNGAIHRSGLFSSAARLALDGAPGTASQRMAALSMPNG
jgi:hypothetical protein